MNKAKQVVETWERQFYSAPREQRLAFLYLANDILQNSRRKGAEFVAEFWKVLPDSLRDVIEHGDEFGRNAALRLINIWEERKVFGSRGQLLKEELVKRHMDNGNKNLKREGFKLRSPGGIALDKIISGYQAVYGSQLEEDGLFNKCTEAITFFEKVDKDIEGNFRLDELKQQHAVLRDCIGQLVAVESSRANLVSLLQEALHEQEYKLVQVRDQLQAAQTQSEQAGGICQQLLGGNGHDQVQAKDGGIANQSSAMPPSLVPGASEQPTPVIYKRQESGHIEENPKSAAAAMAAKLAASASSAQMLTFVLSSLASEGVIGNTSIKESSSEYPSEKRAKIENEQHSSYIPPQVTQGPTQPFPDTTKLQHNVTVTSQEFTLREQPPDLQPLQPPLLQYPMPQYLQTAMPMQMPLSSGSYSYSMNPQQLPASLPPGNYAPPPIGHPLTAGSEFSQPSNGSYPPPEGGFYGQTSSMPMAPMNNQ